MPSQFGQLMTLINLFNQGLYTTAETAISAYKMRGEASTAMSQAQTQAQIDQMKAAANQATLQQETLAAQNKNALLQKLAIYGGIGLAIIIIFVFIGTSYIKKKRDEKYEYVIEETQ